LLVLWWHSVRRRSQKRPISWTRMLDLATRWLPAPQVLHPYPEARFAATPSKTTVGSGGLSSFHRL
jgi:RNA-directed DNA polymerase